MRSFHALAALVVIILSPFMAYDWVMNKLDERKSNRVEAFVWDRSKVEHPLLAQANEELITLLPRIMYSPWIEEYEGVKIVADAKGEKSQGMRPYVASRGRGEYQDWWAMMVENKVPIMAIQNETRGGAVTDIDRQVEYFNQYWRTWRNRGQPGERPTFVGTYYVHIPNPETGYIGGSHRTITVRALYELYMDDPEGYGKYSDSVRRLWFGAGKDWLVTSVVMDLFSDGSELLWKRGDGADFHDVVLGTGNIEAMELLEEWGWYHINVSLGRSERNTNAVLRKEAIEHYEKEQRLAEKKEEAARQMRAADPDTRRYKRARDRFDKYLQLERLASAERSAIWASRKIGFAEWLKREKGKSDEWIAGLANNMGIAHVILPRNETIAIKLREVWLLTRADLSGSINNDIHLGRLYNRNDQFAVPYYNGAVYEEVSNGQGCYHLAWWDRRYASDKMTKDWCALINHQQRDMSYDTVVGSPAPAVKKHTWKP